MRSKRKNKGRKRRRSCGMFLVGVDVSGYRKLCLCCAAMYEEEPWTLPLPSSEKTPPLLCILAKMREGFDLLSEKGNIYFELEGFFFEFPLFFILFYIIIYFPFSPLLFLPVWYTGK